MYVPQTIPYNVAKIAPVGQFGPICNRNIFEFIIQTWLGYPNIKFVYLFLILHIRTNARTRCLFVSLHWYFFPSSVVLGWSVVFVVVFFGFQERLFVCCMLAKHVYLIENFYNSIPSKIEWNVYPMHTITPASHAWETQWNCDICTRFQNACMFMYAPYSGGNSFSCIREFQTIVFSKCRTRLWELSRLQCSHGKSSTFLMAYIFINVHCGWFYEKI